MFSIDRTRSELAAVPFVVKVGLAVMAAGGLGDVVAHLEIADHVGHLHAHASSAAWAHVTGFVGMVVVFVGVVTDGVHQQRLRRAEPTSKGVA